MGLIVCIDTYQVVDCMSTVHNSFLFHNQHVPTRGCVVIPLYDKTSPRVFKSIGIQGTNTGLLTTGIFGVVKTVFDLCLAALDD